MEIAHFGGFLAVDAMSMRPHVFVTKNGFVQGLVEGEFVGDTDVAQMKTKYEEYERYVASLKNKTITDSFIYQFLWLEQRLAVPSGHRLTSTEVKVTKGSQIKGRLIDQNVVS